MTQNGVGAAALATAPPFSRPRPARRPRIAHANASSLSPLFPPAASTPWFGLPSLLPFTPLSASRLRGGAAPARRARRGPVFGLFGKAADDDDGDEWEDESSSESESDGEGYVGSAPPEGLEQGLSIRRIAGDGRCMFRALVRREREREMGGGEAGGG